MRKTKTLLTFLLACLALTSKVAAQGGAVKDIPATSTISNDSWFQIRSFGGNDYVNSSSVRSVVQTHGDWILDLSGSKRTSWSRTVDIDFNPVVGGPPAPFSTVNAPARFIASCHRTGYDVNMLTMPLNEPKPCPLNITFDHLGDRYGIAMNSTEFDEFGYDFTDSVTITCTVKPDTQCKEWMIRPYQNGPSSRGKLLKLASKPNQQNVDLGAFNFSFDITVSIP